MRETASVLQLDEAELTANSANNNWLQDLQTSQQYLQRLVNLEDKAVALLNTDTLQLEIVETDLINNNHANKKQVVSSLPKVGSNNIEDAK